MLSRPFLCTSPRAHQWEGYLKDGTPQMKSFHDFIKEYGMKLHHIRTSGHATIDSMKRLAVALHSPSSSSAPPAPVYSPAAHESRDALVCRKCNSPKMEIVCMASLAITSSAGSVMATRH